MSYPMSEISTPESLLLHPLLALNVGGDEWMCRSRQVNLLEYSVVHKPVVHTPSAHMFPMIQHMYTWLRRRNIQAHRPYCGIVSPARKVIYTVDLIAESDDELLLVLFHYTDKRGGDAQQRMLAHVGKIVDACVGQCKVRARGLVINIYGHGRVMGKFVDN